MSGSRPWRDDADESAREWLRRAPLAPLGWCTAAGAYLHRLAAERGWLEQSALPCRVVSIGALQAGGSGKTPTTAALARALTGAGARVAIASRGYGRSAGRSVVCVSDGSRVCAGADEGGDEALLLAAEAPGVPVYVARDRARAGVAAIRARSGNQRVDTALDWLLLDDGFQHHRLARDVDLVCIDATAGLGRACLPRGTRREPLSALSRADGFVILDGPLRERDRRQLDRRAPQARRFAAQRRVRGLRPLGGLAAADCPSPAELAGREVGLLSGIARPASLRRTVEGLGARVVDERVFRDHHRFRADDLRDLRDERVPLWLTTAKDAVKLRASWLRGLRMAVVDLEVRFEDAASVVAWLQTFGKRGA